jgi:ribose-phosphate pyrophosphokinase
MILVNNKKIEVEYFPNKESMVKDFECGYENVVELFYEDDRDLVHLVFVAYHMRMEIQGQKLCAACVPYVRVKDLPLYTNTLIIHYMPYERMDRKIENNIFSLDAASGLINSLKFDKVIVVEPHSNKTIAYLNRPEAIFPSVEWLPQIISSIQFDKNVDCIVFPDEGAKKRYSHTFLSSGVLSIIQFNKKRDPQTGELFDFECLDKLPEGCKKSIILDDLCSRGGTFLRVGQILRDMGVEDISLVVPHLEQTVFEGELLKDNSPINRIYTSNSMIRKNTHNKIIELPIKF